MERTGLQKSLRGHLRTEGFVSNVSVRPTVASGTERDEVHFGVVPQTTPKLFMVHF